MHATFFTIKANINSLFGGFRRVVHCDEMFDVIQSVHEKGSGHSGVQKTFEMVSIISHEYLVAF